MFDSHHTRGVWDGYTHSHVTSPPSVCTCRRADAEDAQMRKLCGCYLFQVLISTDLISTLGVSGCFGFLSVCLCVCGGVCVWRGMSAHQSTYQKIVKKSGNKFCVCVCSWAPLSVDRHLSVTTPHAMLKSLPLGILTVSVSPVSHHTLTHPPTHSLTHSPTHSHTHTYTQARTHL